MCEMRLCFRCDTVNGTLINGLATRTKFHRISETKCNLSVDNIEIETSWLIHLEISKISWSPVLVFVANPSKFGNVNLSHGRRPEQFKMAKNPFVIKTKILKSKYRHKSNRFRATAVNMLFMPRIVFIFAVYCSTLWAIDSR